MKIAYFIFTLLIGSCESGQKAESKNETEKNPQVHGNLMTELKFRNAKEGEIVKHDTLTTHFNYKNLTVLKCETSFLENDYENEDYFIREYEIKISDTLRINSLQRQNKEGIYEYVYLINNDNFSITNLYGEMFSRKSNLYFDFETIKAYQISKDKILLQDQPSTWCGLANQMDFFQIVDLKNRVIIQFVDYDTIVK